MQGFWDAKLPTNFWAKLLRPKFYDERLGLGGGSFETRTRQTTIYIYI